MTVRMQDIATKTLWGIVAALGTTLGGLVTNEIKIFNDHYAELRGDIKSMKDGVHQVKLELSDFRGEMHVQKLRVDRLEKSK